jgi:outer membrane protein assembly factor BamB
MKSSTTNFLSALAIVVTSAAIGEGQWSDQSLKSSNLTMHWEGNIGGTALASGERSFVVWPHSTKKRELVRIVDNGRVLASFRGDEVNEEALEASILEGKRATEIPRLGIEGAKQKAEKLVKVYERIGRKVELQSEDPQQIYAVSISSTGVVCAMDAENGTVLWKNQLPHFGHTILGPGVSDNYVTAVNAGEYFVYDLITGNTVARRKLSYIATGSPLPIDGKVAIPSVGGRLVMYNILEADAAPVVLRIGEENRLNLLVSPDKNFLAWPMKNKLVVSKLETPPILWTSVVATSEIPSSPVGTSDGYLFITQEGVVFRCTSDRINPIKWKTKLGTTSNQSPVIGKEVVTIVSEDGLLFALNVDTGEPVWEYPLQGIQSVLIVTSAHIYAVDTARNLVTIDITKQKISSKLFVGLATAVQNSITDRIYIVDPRGKVSCLREPQAFEPTLFAPRTAAKDPAEETPATDPAATASPGDANSVFGAESTPATPTGDDPFGDPN